MITDAQIAKLPNYARMEIERLRRDLEAAEKQIQAIFGKRKSRIQIDPYRGMMGSDKEPLYLPEGMTVRYLVGSSRHYIDVDICQGDMIRVMSSGGTGGALAILPTIQNSVIIRLDGSHPGL